MSTHVEGKSVVNQSVTVKKESITVIRFYELSILSNDSGDSIVGIQENGTCKTSLFHCRTGILNETHCLWR